MKKSLDRIFIVCLICFFPAALLARFRFADNVRKAVIVYRISLLGFAIFLVLLAFYTFWRGGSFIKPMGTFY